MKYAVVLVPLFLALGLRAADGPPWYDDRKDLLWYRDGEGKLLPVKTAQDWAKRVGHIRASRDLVMGPLSE